MSRINVLWVIDHVCYDGSLHGGGRLYWNVLPRFDPDRFRVVPCLLRANETIREVFKESPVPVRILDKGKYDPTTLMTFLRLIKEEKIHVMHLHCYGASTFGRLAGLLLDGSLTGRGLIDTRTVGRMLDQHQRRAQNFSHRLWGLIVLELWLRSVLD